jgi:hypothetical protein
MLTCISNPKHLLAHRYISSPDHLLCTAPSRGSRYSEKAGKSQSGWRLQKPETQPTGCYTGTRASGFPLGGRRVLRLDLAAATSTRIFAYPRLSRACEQDFQTPRDACANLRWAGRSTQAASTALTSICARTHTHTHIRIRTHAHAHTHAHTHTHTYARARAHKRTPVHPHTRSRARTWRVPT